MATPAPDEVYQGVTRIFMLVILGFGLAIVVVTLARGGRPTSYGVLIGIVFRRSAAGASTSR